MSITLCVRLWELPGRTDQLIAYEDQVLPLIAEHGGTVLERARRIDAGATSIDPLEVHLIRFPSEDTLDAYLADPRRAALATRRDHAIARTEMHRVDLV